jgi:hypothetical protein
MHVGRFQIARTDVAQLRSQYLSDTAPASAAYEGRSDGWLEVNRRYLQEERQRGERSMRALMTVLGVDSVQSVDDGLDLIELAVRVFTPPDGYKGTTVRTGTNEIRIVNPYCPIYRAIEERNWRGVTACPSWHLRRGWLDALDVDATDSVIGEKKWGDPACAAVIRVEACAPVLV